MTILIAEDDLYTREGLIDILENEGFKVAAAEDGERALELFRSRQPDCICLDIMMPKINGYDVCKAIRKEDQQVPVIFLSAKSEEIDKVTGLELGADDYITKPFSPRILAARVKAVLRREGKDARDESSVLQIHDIVIHPGRHEVTVQGQPVRLTYTEFRILQYL
ncbi:MAG: response regulator transcription factor, partial [Candidatus Aminicenantes bacterium]|nr:response regulator transcription factor [Candidatus Aminicenantes bacterium]